MYLRVYVIDPLRPPYIGWGAISVAALSSLIGRRS